MKNRKAGLHKECPIPVSGVLAYSRKGAESEDPIGAGYNREAYARGAVMPTITTLHENWEFAQLRDQKVVDWLPIKQLPTSVHVELLKAGKIPDPVSLSMLFLDSPLTVSIDQFVGLNEWEVQCKASSCSS